MHPILENLNIKQILIDLEIDIDNDTTIVRDTNNHLEQWADGSSRQKINKETSNLNHTLDQINLTDIKHSIQQQ